MNSNIFNCNYKLLQHPDRVDAIRKTGDCYPVNVEYHPTMKCNHQCLRCATVVEKGIKSEHTDTAGDNQSMWTPADAEKLIHGFAEVGVKAVTFGGGGEPLLHPTIDAQMCLVRSHNMDFGVITNLDVAVHSPNLLSAKWIRVSADAATETTHNVLHRPNRAKMDAEGFTRVIENLRYLMLEREKGSPTIGINYLVQKENFDEIGKAVEVFSSLADYIRFTPLHDKSAGSTYNWADLVRAFDAAKEAGKKLNPDFKVIGAFDRFVNMVQNPKDYPYCFWQRIRPVVGADGWLYPCCVLNYYDGYRILDVRAYSCFKTAWDSDIRKKSHSWLNPKKCPPCWVDVENQMACYIAQKDPPHVNFV